jgi:ferric-dicitrate binding protein FerR (iron transport regulator)
VVSAVPFRFLLAGCAALLGARPAGSAEAVLSRPGQCVVEKLLGEATATVGAPGRTLRVEERVPADATVRTAPRTLLTLALSNGTRLELGPESELILEELWQAPFPAGTKVAALPQEPSVSQTRLRLTAGDLRLQVKPLRAAQGSFLAVATPAGSLRLNGGTARLQVRLTTAGLGWCGLEVTEGSGEFERVGGPPVALAAGTRLDFSFETDGAGGVRAVEAAPPPRR